MASDVPTFSAVSGSSSFTRIILLCGPPFCRDGHGFVLAGATTMSEHQWAPSTAFPPAPTESFSSWDLPKICAGINAYAVSSCSLNTWGWGPGAAQGYLNA